MYNICRPFILYNDFLPPSKKKHEWQYCSFGYYDGIDVEENLFSKDSEFSVHDELEKLWDYYVERSEKLEGSFSEQIIFGLRTEKENDNIKEQNFWDDKEEYPFLFFTLIQAEYSNTENISQKIREMETEFTNDSCKVITYFTFDTSDLLMVILCKKYDDGVAVIENFHHKENSKLKMHLNWQITYSFSVAAVYKEIINDKERVANIEGNVQRADIYLIEKELGAIDTIYKKVEDSIHDDSGIDKDAVLGCNDEVIRLENVPWNKFLLFYQDGEGLFSNSNNDYHNGLIGITTIIDTKKLNEENIVISSKEDKGAPLSKKMREKCKNMHMKIEGGEEVDISGIKRNMLQVINSLQKFEETPLRDYLFQTALLPLNMMLDMALEIETKSQIKLFRESFYIFMKGFNLYVQDAGRSDRQFTQVPDFNAKIYDTPAKINAFYNAFIFNMKKYLNDLYKENEDGTKPTLHEYEFLACPGVADNMQVRESFVGVSENKRLFLVEIPEKQVYKPKQMLIMLAHEVGHFVGKDVRNRETRFAYIQEICIEIIIKCLKLEVINIIKTHNPESYKEIYQEVSTEEFWQGFRDKLWDKVHLDEKGYDSYFINKFKSKEGGDKTEAEKKSLRKSWESRKFHSNVVVEVYGDLITETLCEEGEKLWAYIIEKYYLSLIERGVSDANHKRDKLRVELNQYVAKITSIPIWNHEMLTIKTAMDTAMNLFKECIADLICILTLNLNVVDYFDAIINSAKDQEMEIEDKETTLMLRIVLVVVCMTEQICETDMAWNDDHFKRIEEMDNQSMLMLWWSVRNIKDDFIIGEKNIVQSQIDEFVKVKNLKVKKLKAKPQNTKFQKAKPSKLKFLKAVDALYDYEIIIKFLKYLKKCKSDFSKFDQREENAEERKKIHEKIKSTYSLFSQPEIETMLLKMNGLTDDYLKKIQELNKEESVKKDGGK